MSAEFATIICESFPATMNPRTIIRLCFSALVAIVLFWVWHRWKYWSNEKEVYKLLSILILAVGGGILFVTVILPKFGDAVGTVMFSSGEEITAHEGMKAAAKMASGDYLGAIEEYEVMMKDKPDDPFPISEIAKIHADKLEDPATALAFLQEHLESQDWSEENASFLMFRMVDLHLSDHQFDAAKDILQQVVSNFPGTRHSANAKHRINEVELAQFKEAQASRSQGDDLV
jgi:tetratricopeptide (TPR) repeat protein